MAFYRYENRVYRDLEGGSVGEVVTEVYVDGVWKRITMSEQEWRGRVTIEQAEAEPQLGSRT
jgi:hypothetical protein